MDRDYIISVQRNGFGRHEVHAINCDMVRKMTAVRFLGKYPTGQSAVQRAELLGYSGIDCCWLCVPEYQAVQKVAYSAR